jgi:predicted nucleic acid-binding protein
MPANKLVINASPLIFLFNTELAFVLPKMFQEIVVPQAVYQEILADAQKDKAAQQLRQTSWIKKAAVENATSIIKWDLGEGETAVLSFALSHPDFYAVVDDSMAKKCARSFSIKTLGTGSIMILAKEKHLITSVETSLRKLRESGMWISDSVIQLLKEKAGE